VEATLGVSAITKPLGKLSVKSDCRVARGLVLVNVIVRVEIPPGLMVAGLKILLTPTPPAATPHGPASTMLLISVTAPFRAKSLPVTLAELSRLILVSARMFPMKVLPDPIVAVLVTCQNTLQGEPPIMETTEPLEVMREDDIRKIQTSAAPPVRVSVPARFVAAAPTE
jgi:hypothetical protein